jgi:O-antigen ligase
VDFALFILVTAILFIRPTDFVPGLEGANLYLVAIVPCIILSWHKLVPQLSGAGLRERPVFVFGIGILLLAIASCLLRGQFDTGVDFTGGFLKILTLYLLLLAQVDSPGRLKLFLGCLVGIILVPILLAVLNYHDVITIPAFRTSINNNSGDVRRLGATGNFGDANDVCEILNCALIFSLYGLLDRGGGLARVLWLAPLALFAHALSLTHSRGGFLGSVVGMAVLFRSRFRGVKSLVLAGAVAGLMFVLFEGRQTSLSTSSGTSQQRIQMWDACFEMLKGSPLIGVGLDGVRGRTGLIAHNAFVQISAELGLLGGTFLFGQYFWCLSNLAKLGPKRSTLPDPELRRLQPFLLAALASFATSEMSLTNAVCPTTYVMFGLATVFIRLADPSPPLPDLLLNPTLVRRIFVSSGLFLLGLYVFVRLNVAYG